MAISKMNCKWQRKNKYLISEENSVMAGKIRRALVSIQQIDLTKERSTPCGRRDFATRTFRCCFPRMQAPKTSRTRKAPRLLKEQRQELGRELWWEERWDG